MVSPVRRIAPGKTSAVGNKGSIATVIDDKAMAVPSAQKADNTLFYLYFLFLVGCEFRSGNKKAAKLFRPQEE
ncbi:hypothetical protein CBP51_18050 [Cellvibrio mixtus]|uniref:Uncharacterized protein n=1 Tax=Cellvibrio mixtus TaxID=39650 RepID=A0A266Q590_9GAMM|nr:hypothetical protein [Cellvibrio mixtus]OZY85048.1 hypothetical protein CBP51_18050 [Cellvibrio mixtus]